MRVRIAAVLLLLAVSIPALAREKSVYFSVTADKTFRPDEKPRVQLYARDVESLEFRIYRINDPLKFFQQLQDVHRFGPRYSVRERVDDRTWLERFHDWKRNLWRRIRRFFRRQFSSEAREEIRAIHSRGAQVSRVTGKTGFAAVPVLNSQQLVSRWRLQLPPRYLSESSELPIESLAPGTYVLEATDGTYRAYTVLLVSDLALVTKSYPGSLLAYTVRRNSGEPVAGTNVTIWRKQKIAAQFTTDAQGLGQARIAPETEQEREMSSDYGSEWVLAQNGANVALVAPYSLNLSSNPEQDWQSYVYTDRPVYRPGDTVHFRLILRKRNGDRVVLPAERDVQVEIQDAANNTVHRKVYSLSSFGTVNGSMDLPASAPLGYYSISLSRGNVYGSFQVEEYKKPDYFVKVTPEKTRVLQGEKARATIEARYYFGEPVANAKVTYVVHTQRSYYFGGDDSESTEGGGDEGSSDDTYYFGEQILEEQGKLDANGRLSVVIPTRVEDKHKIDTEYRIEARVTDAANREIAGHNSVLATYGSFHLGIDAQSYVYKQGDEGKFTVQAIDYDKHPVRTAVRVEVLRYRYGAEEAVLQTTDVTTGADGFAHVTLPLNVAGDFRVRATARAGERQVTDTTWVWVTGPGQRTWAEGESRNLQIVADKSSYKIGDTARVLVMGVVPDSTLLVTTEGSSVLTRRLVRAPEASATIDIPITADNQPNVFVSVVFVRDDHVYEGSKSLSVPLAERRLSIEVTPAKAQFIPGEAATYNILARDWLGKPVQAELSVGVVDDAVYAVVPDRSGDIVKSFYGERYSSVQTQSSFEFYFQGEAGSRPIELARVGGGGGGGSGQRRLAQVKATEFVQPKIRKAFPDTAFWQANVRTDANGRATVKLAFPDSLTTWRTTVRAVTQDTKAGWAVNRVLVRKNLMVRLAVPRFFRNGDQVVVSAIVHNYLDTPKLARVQLEASGLEVIEGGSRDVNVPVRGEAKVDWRVKTVAGASSAKLLTKALTNEESDAMELTLPVVPFGVPQGSNAAGAITESTGQRTATIELPPGSDPASRDIEIQLSPSLAGSVLDSLEYLTSFPYGCTEQTMSSFLPNVIVASTIRDLKVGSRIDENRLNTQVNAGLQRLYGFQHDDGGWGWWKDDESMVFMTAYVVAGMAQAKDAGYSIHESRMDRGKQYLQRSLREHPNMIADLRAYVVYALSLAGNRDAEDLNSVWRRKSKLSAAGVAFAGMSMKLSSDARLNEAVGLLRKMAKTEGDAVYWPASFDSLMEVEVDSSSETTAHALKLLSQVSPQDPLLPKAIIWLMRHRNEGYYWYSTKQTAMVIYGVVDYLKVRRELDPDFTAEVLVNGTQVSTRRFTAAEAKALAPVSVRVPNAQLAATNQIVIRKNGAGRLYWSARGSYYSSDKRLYNAGRLSLSIARDYYKLTSVNSGQKITYDLTPLQGPLSVGDILAVRVTIGGADWKYLIVEDPVPAGAEFIERDELYEVNQKPSWWRNWYTRREFHDNRAAIFETYFDGHREYFYLLKVVNPGLFQVSPASVQPMYQPDVLATTPASTMEVK